MQSSTVTYMDLYSKQEGTLNSLQTGSLNLDLLFFILHQYSTCSITMKMNSLARTGISVLELMI
jgi:hypothetical protein